MRSPWSPWLLLAVVICLSLGAVPANAESELDVRGTWKTTIVAESTGTRFRNTLVITDQDAAGDVRGSWDIHGSGATARMEGSISGARMVLRTTKANAAYRYTGTVRDRNGALVWSGRWVGPVASWTGTFTATMSSAVVEVSDAGGDRASATLVICDRDMTASPGDAVLECTAQVTDASAQPGSTTPTGSVGWTADRGSIAPGSCTLVPGGGSTAWCAVILRASSAEIPIGTAPPVTASYEGDQLYGRSDGSPQLYGAATGYSASDTYGPGCNPASVPQPTIGCGDPVNPATGNLVMSSTDLALPGRGPGLVLERTYNSLAAAAGDVGRFGAGWSDTYGARIMFGPKKAVTVHLGSGATVPFTAKGRRFTAPGWVTATLVRGAAKGYTLTFHDRTTLAFDRQGRLVAVSDRSGEPVSVAYAGDGTVTTATDASGRAITFGSDSTGRVVAATDPAGRTVRYGYDAAGDLVAVTDVAGATTAYGYDAEHRLISVTDAAGSRTANRYDSAGRVAGQTDPLGNTMSFAYAGTHPDLVTVATDGNGVRTAFEFRRGVLVAETRALDGDAPSTTNHVYDARLTLVATIDPNRHLWRFTRDTSANVLTSTDPLGRTTTATYSTQGDLLSLVSPAGVTTRVDRDDHGLPIRVVRGVGTPEEATIIIGRDDAEHPADITSITDPLGAVTTFGYDEHGAVTGVVDALGNTSTMTRDELGWLMAATDPMGAVTSVSWDVSGHPVTVVDPLGGSTSLVRDALGRPASATDTLGQTTTVVRDATGRTTGRTLPDGTILGTAYDATGATVSQIDGGGAVWTIERDDHGRASGWVDPLGDRWQVAYDAGGRPTSATDPTGAVTGYVWDAADQLLGINHEDGTRDVSFTYDADGRRAAMTDGTGTTSYAHDGLGRLTSVTDGAGRTVATTYDAAGNLSSVTYPDGRIVERDHDANGRLVAVRDWLGNESTFARDAAGRLAPTVAGDGSITDRTYDARGGLLSITVTAAGVTEPLLAFTYGRDPLGRVASLTETLAASAATGPIAATRDTRGRLTALGDATFELDAIGNLTRLRDDTLAYDTAGRLVSADGPDGTTRFTNDAAGRRTAVASGPGGSTTTYTWDAAGNLVAAGAASFADDGDGLRTTADWGDGTSSAFTWLRSTEPPQLLGDGASWYVSGPDGMPLEEIRADGSVQWLHIDQAGSIRALTDDAGTLIGTFSWDAYGLPVGPTSDARTRLGFQGHYTDPGTGLLDLHARPYDPTTGRFLAVDPLVMVTREPYAFASGDPLTFGDPSGTDSILFGPGHWGTNAGGMLEDLGFPPTATVCTQVDAITTTMAEDLQGMADPPAGPGKVRKALEQSAGSLADGMQQALETSGVLDAMGPQLQQAADDILSGRVERRWGFGF